MLDVRVSGLEGEGEAGAVPRRQCWDGKPPRGFTQVTYPLGSVL